VLVDGLTPTEKSVTAALPDVKKLFVPFVVTFALLETVPATVGVTFKAIFALAPIPSVPTEQVTVEFTAAVHAPGVAVAVLNVAPDGRTVVKITFDAGSVPAALLAMA
jgi:hypothetical protein